MYNKLLSSAKRIVVKVGTSTLTHRTGKLNIAFIESLVHQIADLKNSDKEILLVSSGAVGAGMGKLGITLKPKALPEKQALAAIGQGILMHMYEKVFAEYGQTVAQILLTRDDLSERKRYLNARNTVFSLLHFGAVPVINENDTVAVEEIKQRIGENDTLAALVAGLVDADLLILLSDIDGLYTKNPSLAGAKKIPLVEVISDELEKYADGVGSKFGTGGMNTKIKAAKIAVAAGIPMVIADGTRKGVLGEITSGQNPGTLFLPHDTLHGTRKYWLAFCSDTQGKITIDDGAAVALLKKGKSLLPAGIISIENDFEAGNIVCVTTADGKEIARGFVNYSSEEIKKIKGAKSSEIVTILGYKDYDEVIHRDNLALKV